MSKADAFVFACRENPEVLRSLEYILDTIRERFIDRLCSELEDVEVRRAQGAIRAIHMVGNELTKLVRLRDAADKSANGRN